MIKHVLELEMSAWEEKLAAAAFLHGLSIMEGAFNAAAAAKLTCALEKLSRLPHGWAEEACTITLKETEKIPAPCEARGS